MFSVTPKNPMHSKRIQAIGYNVAGKTQWSFFLFFSHFCRKQQDRIMADLNKGTKIDHDLYGEGIVANVNLTNYDIYFARGGKMAISKSSDEFKVLDEPEGSEKPCISLDVKEFEKMFLSVLDGVGLLLPETNIGKKWEDGKLILKPGKEEMQSKEIPIESFFRKIVMVRDRLRVLEQNINSNQQLSDDDKMNLQQYISRIYGSLTTFNVLFDEKSDYFVGTGKGK